MVSSFTFHEIWLDYERFKYWLKKHSSGKHKAVWKLYNYKNSSVLKMGVSTIISHMNGKNHQRTKNVTSPSQSLYFKGELIRRAVLIVFLVHRVPQKM